MSNIKITFKDGRVKEFKHQGRDGGSYTKKLSYEAAFVIVEDEWGKKTSFPAADIEQIEEQPHEVRYSW